MTLNLPPTPGLQYAALISPTGHLLASLGQSRVEPAITAVLAQGAMAALTDLGQRSEIGSCHEVTSVCANGGVLMLTDSSGKIALLQYGGGASLDQLRQVGCAMLAPAAEPASMPPANRQSLMDALNAGPP